jgi:hypothetical protein
MFILPEQVERCSFRAFSDFLLTPRAGKYTYTACCAFLLAQHPRISWNQHIICLLLPITDFVSSDRGNPYQLSLFCIRKKRCHLVVSSWHAFPPKQFRSDLLALYSAELCSSLHGTIRFLSPYESCAFFSPHNHSAQWAIGLNGNPRYVADGRERNNPDPTCSVFCEAL